MINRITYDQLVVKAIKNFKKEIEVTGLQYVKSLYYSETEYKKISKQVKEKRFEELVETHPYKGGFREYLEILTFFDQSGAKFIAMIYDSDELWQDPEAIDVFPYD
jgi:hypothetical protein